MKSYKIEREPIYFEVPQIKELLQERIVPGLSDATDQFFQEVLLDNDEKVEIFLGHRFDRQTLKVGDEIKYSAYTDYFQIFDKDSIKIPPYSKLIEVSNGN